MYPRLLGHPVLQTYLRELMVRLNNIIRFTTFSRNRCRIY